MNKRSQAKISPFGVGSPALKYGALILLLLISMSCGEPNSHDHTGEAAATYTCPMHPHVVQNKPGSCPVCGMDLVRVTQMDRESDELMLTDSQMLLANITTAPVTVQRVGQTTIVNAQIKVDEQKSEVISSRAAGRIEKLFIKETGQRVQRGEPLYVLYSEELLTLQQEYLLAKEQFESLGDTEERYKSFLDAAERKLRLYGLTPAQIGQLHRNTLRPRVTFQAPSSGIVTSITATEGQYVNEGTTLYEIEDITSLWVEAELYPKETSLVEVGDMITVSASGIEDKVIETKVDFLSPEYRNNSQVTIMRAPVKNPEGVLKPGQFAQVYLNNSSAEALAVPMGAVIRDANGSHVYVQSGRNTFRPQMVKTGLEGFDRIEITEGLKQGDTVAISGAYLLYSEIILKQGKDPIAVHNH